MDITELLPVLINCANCSNGKIIRWEIVKFGGKKWVKKQQMSTVHVLIIDLLLRKQILGKIL